MKKLFLTFAIVFAISMNAQDTLRVYDGNLKLLGSKSVHFVKSESEMIYVGCHLPKFVKLSKRTNWIEVIYSDGKKERYFIDWIETKKTT
jgi:hypothetical protein